MTMTAERLAELDAVMAKATAGGWSAKTTVKAISVVGPRNRIAKMAIVPMSARNPEGQDDAAAIVALHNAYPDLRAHIEAQAATIAGLREALQPLSLFTIPSESSDGDVLADSNCGLEANFITVSDVRKARAALTGAA